MNRIRLTSALGALTLVSAAVLVPTATAAADPLVVDSLTDDGVGYTLREAVADAQGSPDPRITFAESLANGTLQLAGPLIINQTLSIEGLGSAALSISVRRRWITSSSSPTPPVSRLH